MGNIVLLDDLTINKIAAGEVIERPSSVVKEMVENSIDAGAKNITVEIRNGGISLIKITDDGCGISEDDMEIAFERHATSKIRKAEDLEIVTTMGFRGEALASIAAIARVEMVSKKSGETCAHKIVVEGGKKIEFTETARSVGTTISVENLFYNTPVRYKFLKKDYTETGYIEDVITRIALVNRDVAIKLINNGKTIIQTNGNNDLKTVIYNIYGKDIANEIIEVNYEYENIKVTGVVANAVVARGNRTNQLFFLNGRYIKDKALTAATDQAYKGIVPVGRYGFAILNLEMDPKEVDVNVHPAKLEVRFADESKVFKAVYNAIKDTFTKNDKMTFEKIKENITVKTEEKESLKDNYQDENVVKFSTNIDVNADEFFSRRKAFLAFDNLATEKNPNENIAAAKSYENIKNELTDDTENVIHSRRNRNNKSEDKKSIGFSNIFKKIIKEPDETDEELNNNHLEEIFKNRQNFVEESTINNSIINDKKENVLFNEKEPIIKEENIVDVPKLETINDNELNKDIKLGNTIISSNTMELNVATVNELIRNKFSSISNVETKENIENTQVITENVLNNQETVVLDMDLKNTENNISSFINKETMAIDLSEEKESEENDNEISEKDNKIEENEITESDIANKNNIIDNVKNESVDPFAEIAKKMVEAKLELDNTQFVNTDLVRQAIKSSNAQSKDDIQDTDEINADFDEMYKKTFGVETFEMRKNKENQEKEKSFSNVTNEFAYVGENLNVFDNEEVAKTNYKYLGIAFSKYIFIEIKSELYIVDQYAAAERIIYEKIKQYYYNDARDDKQDLLMPDVIDVNAKQMILARENKSMFNNAGFDFEEFGENTLKLIAVPSICEELNTKQLFIEILNQLDKVAITAKEEKEDKFVIAIAEKIADNSKLKLEENEILELIDGLLKLDNPLGKYNGKNIAMTMSKYDLEKKFNRR